MGLPFAFGLALLSIASAARADDCAPQGGLSTCIDADNLWPHAGPGTLFAVGSTDTTVAGQVSFGLVTTYLSRPVGLRIASADPDGTVIYAVDDAVDATTLMGLGVTDRLELSIAVPVTLYQSGAGLADVLGTDEALPRSAMRHLRFGAAFAILPRPRLGSRDGVALTTRFELALPTGDARAFTRGSTAVGVPSLVFDYVWRDLTVGTELSARIRGEDELGGARVGTQLGASLGGSYMVLPQHRVSAGLEAYALYTLADQDPPLDERAAFEDGPALVPAEWIASVSAAPFFGGDLGFSIGGGGALPLADASAVTTPRMRFDLGVRYAPLGLDADADGVLDRDDRCPAQVEDRDGYQDEDGCADPDNDKDGVADAADRCRDAAETVDGFEDEDGCPDLDDDEDGVADEADQCRNAAEDVDRFEDADGCPDADNDEDGILDAADTCPNGAEDRDGFRDDDGCPDPDNDLDQIADAADACPDVAEDRDGFEDEDGCPEPDNDVDGVLDAQDRCPTQAETIDGATDEDGCPEPGARSLVMWSGDRVVLEKPAAFARGRAALTPALEKQARMAAMLLASRAPLASIIVEAYPDRAGDASVRAQELSASRADAVKAALVQAGLPADRITAAAGDPSAKRPPGAAPFDITAVRERPKKRN